MWSVTSIGQDLLYAVSGGKIRPPKHIILPSAIKSLTGNVQCIQILNHLGHGISYSSLQEIDTALCPKKMAPSPNSVAALPSNTLPYANVTLGKDNIDRQEETLSGPGTPIG